MTLSASAANIPGKILPAKGTGEVPPSSDAFGVKRVVAGVQLHPLLPWLGVLTDAALLVIGGWVAVNHLLLQEKVLLVPVEVRSFNSRLFWDKDWNTPKVFRHLERSRMQLFHTPVVGETLHQIPHDFPEDSAVFHPSGVDLHSLHCYSESPFRVKRHSDIQRLGHGGGIVDAI